MAHGPGSLCDVLKPKQRRNLAISRFPCKLEERRPRCVRRLAERRKALQESADPSGVAETNSVGEVIKLDRQITPSLAKIFNRPTSRCRAELRVRAVNVGTALQQQIYDLTMAIHSGIVECRGARLCRRLSIGFVSIRTGSGLALASGLCRT